MTDYQRAIDILANAKAEIAEILVNPEDQNHALRLSHALQKEIDRFSLVTGSEGAAQPTIVSLGPATTILGEKVPEKTTAEDLTPKQAQIEAFKTEVNQAYMTFASTDSEQLLLGLSEAVIRGVAKKAGMKVTKEEPKTISVAFIEKVKKEIAANEKARAEKVKQAEMQVGKLLTDKEAREKEMHEAELTGDAAIIAPAVKAFDAAVLEHNDAVERLESLKISA